MRGKKRLVETKARGRERARKKSVDGPCDDVKGEEEQTKEAGLSSLTWKRSDGFEVDVVGVRERIDAAAPGGSAAAEQHSSVKHYDCGEEECEGSFFVAADAGEARRPSASG